VCFFVCLDIREYCFTVHGQFYLQQYFQCTLDLYQVGSSVGVQSAHRRTYCTDCTGWRSLCILKATATRPHLPCLMMTKENAQSQPDVDEEGKDTLLRSNGQCIPQAKESEQSERQSERQLAAYRALDAQKLNAVQEQPRSSCHGSHKLFSPISLRMYADMKLLLLF